MGEDKSFLALMTSILLSLETRMKLSFDRFGLVNVHRFIALNFVSHFYATRLRNCIAKFVIWVAFSDATLGKSNAVFT